MKKILIDSHILLWWLSEPEKLKDKHISLIKETTFDVTISIASLWEIQIKASLKKLTLPDNFKEVLDKNFISTLSIRQKHLYQLLDLPFYHKDPFDRLIISQAITEKIPIISYDSSFEKYSVELI